jgi:ABC-type multidrug transport system fused ATPase/permease subunit
MRLLLSVYSNLLYVLLYSYLRFILQVLAMYHNVLRYPLYAIPKLATSSMELLVSVNRIEAFLAEPEVPSSSSFSSSSSSSLRVEGGEVFERGGNVGGGRVVMGFYGRAAFGYGGDVVRGKSSSAHSHGDEEGVGLMEPEYGDGDGDGRMEGAVIWGLDIEFKVGSFTIVVGPTGCGKSTMLLALLGGIPVFYFHIVNQN